METGKQETFNKWQLLVIVFVSPSVCVQEVVLENKHNPSPLIYITFFIKEPTNCVTRKIQSETSCFTLFEVTGKKPFWLLPTTFTLCLPSFQWLCILLLFLVEFQKQWCQWVYSLSRCCVSTSPRKICTPSFLVPRHKRALHLSSGRLNVPERRGRAERKISI